jgi:hypothetical protein
MAMQKLNFTKNLAIAAACSRSRRSAPAASAWTAAADPDPAIPRSTPSTESKSPWPRSQSSSIPATATPCAWRKPSPKARAPSCIAIDAEGNLPAGRLGAAGKAADAIVFGSPTYMGSVSWQFKKFADASSKPWFAQEWKDKLFAGFTNSASMNGDKFSTLTYLFTLAMQHGGCG